MKEIALIATPKPMQGAFPYFMSYIDPPLINFDFDTGDPNGGYCHTVLANAAAILDIRTNDPDKNDSLATMPAGKSQPIHAFKTHRNELEILCGIESGGPTSVPNTHSDEANFLSPPIIMTPLYACSDTVGVRGVRDGAVVELFLNGASVGTKVAEDPDLVSFRLIRDLTDQDEVYAKQKWNGYESGESKRVSPVEYDKQLPSPSIQSPIHECSSRIGVLHWRGAKLTVTRKTPNGDVIPTPYSSPSGYSMISVPAPEIGSEDSFVVTQELCAGTESEPSNEMPVDAPPNGPYSIGFRTDGIYEQQRATRLNSIVEGAQVEVFDENAAPTQAFFTSPSWPKSKMRANIAGHLRRPLEESDDFRFEQKLCEGTLTTSPLPPLKSCNDLPAPLIVQPLAGKKSIDVQQSVTSAVIHVVDEDGNEIGDGAGSTVRLSRPFDAAETIEVWQELPGPKACKSASANQYIVHPQ